MSSKKKEIFLVIIFNLFFFSLIEAGVRYYAHSQHIMPESLRGVNFTEATKLLRPSVHPQAGFRFLSHLDVLFLNKKLTTNSRGFRGDEFNKNKVPGSLRIAVIGDSVSAGWGVADHEVYSELLERELTRICKRQVEVLNLAIPGQSATQEYFVLREFIDYDLDYVVINYVGNDWNDESVARPRDYLNSPSYALNFVIVNILSRLGEFQKRQHMEWRPFLGNTNSDIKSLPAAYVEIDSLLERKGLASLVVLDSRYESEIKSHEEFEKRLIESGFDTLNLLKLWHPIGKMSGSEAVQRDDEHNRKYLIPIDFHPNALWHRDVSQMLASTLKSKVCQL